jgi:hypothetical protein
VPVPYPQPQARRQNLISALALGARLEHEANKRFALSPLSPITFTAKRLAFTVAKYLQVKWSSLSLRNGGATLFHLRRNSAPLSFQSLSQGILGFFFSVAYFIDVALMERGSWHAKRWIILSNNGGRRISTHSRSGPK